MWTNRAHSSISRAACCVGRTRAMTITTGSRWRNSFELKKGGSPKILRSLHWSNVDYIRERGITVALQSWPRPFAHAPHSLPTLVHTFKTRPISQFRRLALTASRSNVCKDRIRAPIPAARLLRRGLSRRVRVVSRAPNRPCGTSPVRDLRAQRSHVAGHRAPIHVSKRPHVPAFTRECACQMRIGGSS